MVILRVVMSIFYVSLAIILAILIGKFHYEDYKEKKKKLNNIMSFCNKKTYTFAELREELSKISNLTYIDLFEINFELADIEDETEVTITLYFSKKDTEKKLRKMLGDSLYICKIGSMKYKEAYDLVIEDKNGGDTACRISYCPKCGRKLA